MSQPHTVVVGGGLVGVATAYYLAKFGQNVTLVEQDEIGSGCSCGNAGQITPGHLPLPQPGTLGRNLRWLLQPTSPLYIAPRLDIRLFRWLWRFQRACNPAHLRMATEVLCRLGAASSDLFAELAADIGLRYEYPGRLEVCHGAETYRSACAEAELLGEFGFASQRLTGAEIRQFEPAIRADVAGGVYYPQSGFCHPERSARQLAEAAQQLGATVRTHTLVTDVRVRRDRPIAVTTPGGDIEADRVVLAMGSWTPRLARRLGLHLPVQPGKGYHLDLARPDPTPRVPVVLMEERIFVTPIDDFLRLAGTMEFSGFNLTLRRRRLDMLSVGASRYLAGLDTTSVQSEWCHMRPMTPDGLPIIGPAGRGANLWIATGHGMLGLTQAPVTGKLLAESITTGQPSIDLSPFRPDRF